MITHAIAFLGECGLRYTKDHFITIYSYLDQMIKDGRIFMIYKDGIPVSFIAVSICREPDCQIYYFKDTWQYVSHDLNGDIAYIEKFVSLKYDRKLRLEIEKKIKELFKNVILGLWFRPHNIKDDRIMISKLRGDYHVHN